MVHFIITSNDLEIHEGLPNLAESHNVHDVSAQARMVRHSDIHGLSRLKLRCGIARCFCTPQIDEETSRKSAKNLIHILY
jgi:hypothetical protein